MVTGKCNCVYNLCKFGNLTFLIFTIFHLFILYILYISRFREDVHVTVRNIESMIRMTNSIANMHLREFVQKDDVASS